MPASAKPTIVFAHGLWADGSCWSEVITGVLEDEFSVASLMAIELKAGLACDQGLKKGLALDQLQSRNVPAIKVQEIESVIDEPHFALAVSRRLGLREAR
jgi:hypothetical protein